MYRVDYDSHKMENFTLNQYRYIVGITLVSRWAEFDTSIHISVPVITVPGNIKKEGITSLYGWRILRKSSGAENI